MPEYNKAKSKTLDLNARRLQRFERWGERANLFMTAGLLLTFGGAVVGFALDLMPGSTVQTLAEWVFFAGVFCAGAGMVVWVLLGVLSVFERFIQWTESLGKGDEKNGHR
jgi:hypothetical protein